MARKTTFSLDPINYGSHRAWLPTLTQWAFTNLSDGGKVFLEKISPCTKINHFFVFIMSVMFQVFPSARPRSWWIFYKFVELLRAIVLHFRVLINVGVLSVGAKSSSSQPNNWIGSESLCSGIIISRQKRFRLTNGPHSADGDSYPATSHCTKNRTVRWTCFASSRLNVQIESENCATPLSGCEARMRFTGASHHIGKRGPGSSTSKHRCQIWKVFELLEPGPCSYTSRLHLVWRFSSSQYIFCSVSILGV